MDLRHKLNKEHEDRHRMQPQQTFRRPGQDQAQEGNSNPNSGMLCYNCHQSGHHRSQCPNPSFCYGCKQTGHISSKCPNAKANKGLKLCGFGMPGQLFYSLNIMEEKRVESVEAGKQLRAIVTVTEGRGTRFRISEELNYLVGSEIDWQVKRMSTNEFMITVPSVQSSPCYKEWEQSNSHALISRPRYRRQIGTLSPFICYKQFG